MDKFTYNYNGIILTMDDMCKINTYYEAASSAEVLIENYGLSKDDALEKGYEVRRLMDKYEYNETEAINELMEE